MADSTKAQTNDSIETLDCLINPNKKFHEFYATIQQQFHTRWCQGDLPANRLPTNCSIKDFVLQFYDQNDQSDMLSRQLFDVNIRLLKTNPVYKTLIWLNACYILWVLSREFTDYKDIKAVGAATVGVPYNIVAFRQADNKMRTLVNPKIVDASTVLISAKTNCPALMLEESIETKRPSWISIDYHDTDGNVYKAMKIERHQGAFSIQHEIDHNNGILITKR